MLKKLHPLNGMARQPGQGVEVMSYVKLCQFIDKVHITSFTLSWSLIWHTMLWVVKSMR
jgi:hypothetical protein